MSKTRINILRRYPAASHNTPLEYLAENGNYEVKLYEYEASSNPTGMPRNLRFLLQQLLVSTDNIVVLGAEPYDRRVPLFDRLARRHDVILHTSWPYWGTNNVPQPTSLSFLRDQWKSFLDKVHAVGVTQAATESVRSVKARDVTHIPHAVDTSIYHPKAGKLEDKRDSPVVLFVGRLEHRKGVRDLLHVAKQWEKPDVTFRFVGDGPLSDEVKAASKSGPVEYEGHVAGEERLASLYATSDVFALPSFAVEGWEELFGIVIIEAIASGLPVVATDCIGPRDILKEGETGFVVPQQDTEALQRRLHRLITDNSLRQQMGKGARNDAENRYSREHVAQQWESIIERMHGE